MTRRPSSTAHTLAERAAQAVAALDDEPATAEIEAEPRVEPTQRGRGRPKGKREVEARLTLYLDARRHEALRLLAADRGRSIHSLLIEAVDTMIGKPTITTW